MVFSRIVREQEIINLFAEELPNGQDIYLGELVGYGSGYIIKIMNFWCSRVDKIVQLDKEVNGKPTWRSHELLQYRGFSYQEYTALFNKHITVEEFPYYPVFHQLRKQKGGINSEKQRNAFALRYDFNEDDYIRILSEQGFEALLQFFFKSLSVFKANLPLDKLCRHMAIVAPSGSGKTVLMEHLFYQMTKQYEKCSFILIDPHGDLATRARKHRHLRDRCIYIYPFLKEGYTPSFNPFAIKDRSIRNLNNVAEQIIMAFDEVLSREGGEITETMVNMLEKCIYFLLKRPHSTMLDLIALLNRDEHLFQEAAKIDKFFNDFFLKPNNKTREGLLNRISRLMNAPVLKGLLGGESTFDIEQAINQQNKVLIFNLAHLGEMSQVAFGKFLIANIKSIIKKRSKPSKQQTFCLIEEASILNTGSYETALSQLRGFGFSMILANQYAEQYGTQFKTVKQNTAIKIVGGSEENLDDMSKLIKLPPNIQLHDYEFCLKVAGRPMLKFKSSSKLLKEKKKYYLTRQEVQEFDEYMVYRYYKPHEQGNALLQEKQNEEKPVLNESPKPDLGLFINDEA